jgi:hypothetical protein
MSLHNIRVCLLPFRAQSKRAHWPRKPVAAKILPRPIPKWYRLAISLFLFVIPAASVAQTLQGNVVDAVTQLPLYPVTVINVTTQQASYTDVNGFYTIAAKQGDKVAFSYIGYKTLEKYKPISVIISTMNIALEKREYELDEVYLRPGTLTQYQIDSTNRAETYKIQLGRRAPSLMSPASAIAEKFSRKAKQTYRFQQNFAMGEMEKFIDNRYTPELVTSLTGLTGDSIGHFMYAYPMPYDFARVSTNLEMKMWIRDNFRSWIKNKAIDTIAAQ